MTIETPVPRQNYAHSIDIEVGRGSNAAGAGAEMVTSSITNTRPASPPLQELHEGERIRPDDNTVEAGPMQYSALLRQHVGSNANAFECNAADEDPVDAGHDSTHSEMTTSECGEQMHQHPQCLPTMSDGQHVGYDPLRDPMFHELSFYDFSAPNINAGDHADLFAELEGLSYPLTGRELYRVFHDCKLRRDNNGSTGETVPIIAQPQGQQRTLSQQGEAVATVEGEEVMGSEANANAAHIPPSGRKHHKRSKHIKSKIRTKIRNMRFTLRRFFKVPNVTSVLAYIPSDQIVRIDYRYVYFVDTDGATKRVKVPYSWPKGLSRSSVLQGGTILGLHAGLLILILGTTFLILVALI